MESGRAWKKAKTSGQTAGTSGGENAAPSAPRNKAGHESKSLLKRVAFLLNNPDIIPTDVCFYVGVKAEQILGHKIFFALASPVFHASFYGENKPEGSRLLASVGATNSVYSVLAVRDITPEVFRCLMKYVYTDSTASITVANAMDVLVASKKYLMAKLTRYCYELIQKNLEAETAASIWKKSRTAGLDIIEKQSISEIKRNTSRIVSSKGFLELPKDMVLELTGWNNFTISEVELYHAVERWRIYNKEDDGVFQHIRFALFSTERLAEAQAARKILSSEDFEELCLHNLVGKKLVNFNANHRIPVARHLRFSLSVFVKSNTKRQLLGAINVLVWPDVAPKACQVLRQYIEKNYYFTLWFMIHPQDNYVSGYAREIQKGSSVKEVILQPMTEAILDIEKTCALWSLPNFVCFRASSDAPHNPQLTILNTNLTYLGGKLPESVFGEMSEFGVVIGKVLDGPIDLIRQLAAFEYKAYEDKNLNFPTTFECALVND